MSHCRQPLNKHGIEERIIHTEDGLKVKTLFLKWKKIKGTVKRDHVFSYFSEFGAVESVQILKKPTIHLGFVSFIEEESAAKALSRGTYRTISGNITKVAIADSWHQNVPTSVDLPLNESNATGKHILDINDDCLYEMFSLKYISINDLCSLAETCTRFKEIANEVFKKTHKICDLRLLRTTLHNKRRMLINFGPLISEIWIDSLSCFQCIRSMHLVITHCGNTLDSLHLNDFDIPEHLTARLRPLFCHLRKLHIKNCFILGADKNLFTDCEGLEDMDIDMDMVDMDIIFDNTFPKLLRFKCEVKEYVDCEGFISRHTKLKAFSITSPNNCNYLLPIIAEKCEQLEKLEIKGEGSMSTVEFRKALMSLINLQHLSELAIYCDNQNITMFITVIDSLKSLESLELFFAHGDCELIFRMLSQLKGLKILRLTDCFNLKNLNALNHLTQLKELSIRNYIDIF